MMRLNVDGPPGTGKTRSLTEYFERAVTELGPRRVGAITFTRSAADVLRSRAGVALGLGKNVHTLRRRLPYVGTIHSMCYHALGSPKMAGGKEIAEFCDYLKMPRIRGVPDSPDDVEGYWVPQDPGRTVGVGTMLRVLSAARNRKVDVREVIPDLVPPTQLAMYRPAWFEAMIERYADWKQDSGLMDYDDLLEAGRNITLPVSILLADEVQDNSRLIWEVIDAWARQTRVSVFAGDPYQAIFRFSGADPSLFLGHAGDWAHLQKSHRLTDDAIAYSRAVLERGGWDLGLHPTPAGGGEQRGDDSVLYLVRTHALGDIVEDQLQREGTPYVRLRRYSPWGSNAAEAYRITASLKRGDAVRAGSIKVLARELVPGAAKRGAGAALERLASRGGVVTAQEVNNIVPLDAYSVRNQEAWSYMTRVERKHGFRYLFLPPKTMLGTVHAAKGMEADSVVLIGDWGVLPARVAADYGDGARSEACVAYVAVTRHRRRLEIRYWGETPSYPFPERRVHA